jgi:hypothetical protein
MAREPVLDFSGFRGDVTFLGTVVVDSSSSLGRGIVIIYFIEYFNEFWFVFFILLAFRRRLKFTRPFTHALYEILEFLPVECNVGGEP